MSVVRGFEAAFNRQDVDALLACFTERATYRDNFYGEHAGKDALRSMFQRMFREGHDYHWGMTVVVESPTAATAELPVARSGFITIASRPSMSSGSLL